MPKIQIKEEKKLKIQQNIFFLNYIIILRHFFLFIPFLSFLLLCAQLRHFFNHSNKFSENTPRKYRNYYIYLNGEKHLE